LQYHSIHGTIQKYFNNLCHTSSSEESIPEETIQILYHKLSFPLSIQDGIHHLLSLTSAPVHSLLNVGKRIANVICASMVFGTIIPKVGKVGLIIVGAGTLIYSDRFSQCCVSAVVVVGAERSHFCNE
jgi:hypothetical protein